MESVDLKAAADGVKPGVHTKKRLPLPQTVNSEVVMLGSAFIWAHERELIPSVPTLKTKKLRQEPRKRARILTEEESKLFLWVAREMAIKSRRLRVFAKAFRFLLNTGLRSGELCNLTWDDVDLQTGLVKVRPKLGWTPKSASREFYLNNASIKLLNSLKVHDGYVFRTESGKQLNTNDVRNMLILVARAAGINEMTRVHDLRHTFSSHMQMQGVDAPTGAKILGHKDLSTTMIYTHQTEEHLKKSANQVGIG